MHVKRNKMKIRVEIVEGVNEPCCIIQTPALSNQLHKLIDYIKKLDSSASEFVVGYDVDKEKTIILKPEDIFMLCVENKKVSIYTEHNKYLAKKRLCELETLLGNSFLRISKNTIVNVNTMDNIEASFGGILVLTLKNGCKEYISRKYLPNLKECLGI